MHPRDEQLIDWLLGDREERALESTRHHLENGCPTCESRVEEFRELIEHLQADEDPEPPRAWIQRAIALMSPAPAPGVLERLRSFWGEVRPELARVIGDSLAGPTPAFAGVRGASPRRVSFESRELELEVSIGPGHDGTLVSGHLQSLGTDGTPAAGARVLVTSASLHSEETTTDGAGEFSVDARASAPLAIHVAYGDRFVLFEIPSLPAA